MADPSRQAPHHELPDGASATRPGSAADSAGTGGPSAGWKVFLVILLVVLALVFIGVLLIGAT